MGATTLQNKAKFFLGHPVEAIKTKTQGLPRGNFLEAVSDVSIRRYFTQLYAVGLSVYFYLCVHLLTNLNQCKLSANTA